jgi:hypothetical protein
MHSFHPSRGRILLEVFCALAVVASIVGTWRQTHASALLVAAAAVGLLAMVHLFDLDRRPAAAEEPQRIAFDHEDQSGVEASLAAEAPLTAVEPLPVTEAADVEPESVVPGLRATAGRRKGGSRKSSGRRVNAPKAAEVIDFQPVGDAGPASSAEVAEPVHSEEPEIAEPAVPEEAEIDVTVESAEADHVPHAPLFEPEPFVRMQRQAFGRRGRL